VWTIDEIQTSSDFHGFWRLHDGYVLEIKAQGVEMIGEEYEYLRGRIEMYIELLVSAMGIWEDGFWVLSHGVQ